MKKLYKIGIICVSAFVAIVLTLASFTPKKEILAITSPLPPALSQSFPSIFEKLYFWLPQNKESLTDKKMLDITSTSAISYDLTTETVRFSKDIHRRLPIASLTKIMTALVALENEPLGKVFSVSDNAAKIGENSMGLATGENLTLEELLYGLILPSGNDAAEAIAEGSRFGREAFVYYMNKKAEELGLVNTHFTNPSGLEGDGAQYSTAYDLLTITKYALQNSTFQKVVATVDYTIPYSEKHRAFYLVNDTNLLTSYPGVKGVKTGFTDEAGLCLVTYLEYKGHKIIAVLLNSQNRRQEMKELLDYTLKTLGVKPPPHS